MHMVSQNSIILVNFPHHAAIVTLEWCFTLLNRFTVHFDGFIARPFRFAL